MRLGWDSAGQNDGCVCPVSHLEGDSGQINLHIQLYARTQTQKYVCAVCDSTNFRRMWHRFVLFPIPTQRKTAQSAMTDNRKVVQFIKRRRLLL